MGLGYPKGQLDPGCVQKAVTFRRYQCECFRVGLSTV